jgi:uncharacterized iron-regulated membrane protein
VTTDVAPAPLCVRTRVAARMIGVGRTKLCELIGKGEVDVVKVVKPDSPINLRRLHGAIGFWTSPLIILAGITGVMLTRFDVAEAITAPLGASAEFNPAAGPMSQSAHRHCRRSDRDRAATLSFA